jgi:ABC-type sugar transport system permease subunit
MAIVELEAPRTQAAYKPPRFNLAVREALWGYGFISVWIVGFLLFTLIPMIATFVFTFTNINLIQDQPLRFVGLENYQQLFSDPRTWDALLVTFRFAAFALPIGLLLPFSLALLLNSKSLRGSRYFQALFFMPFVIPFVAALFAWGGMLNPEAGWINGLLANIGIDGPDWLNDPAWVYPSLVLIGLWGIGSAIIINIAGLQNVPTELYDAARVDGASAVRQFLNITLPQLRNVLLIVLLLRGIWMFTKFDVPWLLGFGGGVGEAIRTLPVFTYQRSFTYYQAGMGAALSNVMFALLLMAVTLYFVAFPPEEDENDA